MRAVPTSPLSSASPQAGQPAALPVERRAWLRAAAAGALTLGLAGCGFRLRGALKLPFASLRSNLSERSEIGRELRAQLQASGVQLVEPATTGQSQPPADIELTVLKEQRERAVVGITSIGQVRELQLRVRFKFRVRSGKGRDLIDDLELLQERDLSYDEALVLGKQAEEELLYREMQSDIVRQLMRRLAALQPD
ncbi:LPS assembly lipoprotein LptE [Malikia granosa]|uniref:LPS-assembly lipoprotein LptE n=1 Tax=Malikia granosa TaxID=263067 RepID=UPI001FE6698C|nr:LPS assembly lipoprotein LptE [Malikia granosa]